MFTLIALGVGAAYLYSVIGVLFPGLFPSSFREDGEVALYFEAAAVITVLVLLGQLLEGKARNRTGKARAEKVGAETLLSQIVHMVSEAQRSRAPIQKLADQVSGYFVPAVIAVAVLTFIVWSGLHRQPHTHW
jgi:cation transport ATPase